MPIRRLLSCKNSSKVGISKSGSKFGEAPEEELFETFESVQVYDVDQYLDAVLSRQRGS